jgi:hypothetical protein
MCLNLRKHEVRGSFVFAQVVCRTSFLPASDSSRRARRLQSEAGGNEVRQVMHGRTWGFLVRVYGNSESGVPGSDACTCLCLRLEGTCGVSQGLSSEV